MLLFVDDGCVNSVVVYALIGVVWSVVLFLFGFGIGWHYGWGWLIGLACDAGVVFVFCMFVAWMCLLVIDLMLMLGWCLFVVWQIVGFGVNRHICNCVLLLVDLLGLIVALAYGL